MRSICVNLALPDALTWLVTNPVYPTSGRHISKDVLIGTKCLDELDFMTSQAMKELALTRHFASVLSIDTASNSAQLSTGERVGYGALLFANGGRPRRLYILGGDLPGVLTLRGKEDALRLADRLKPGQHIVIIGGGFIGLEVAASARKQNCKVTLFERGSQLMSRAVPSPIAERVKVLHESRGVRLYSNVSPTHITQDGDKLVLAMSNDTTVVADTVVLGIGIEPSVEIARTAGVRVARGILVDSQLRTNVANIFAAGDIAEFQSSISGALMRQETWQNAESQARVVAQNLIGGHVTHTEKSWFWSDQYDYQLQVSGEPSAGVNSVVRELDEGDLIIFYLDDNSRIVGACGWGLTVRIARELKIARVLVERDTFASAEVLANPSTRLKSLL